MESVKVPRTSVPPSKVHKVKRSDGPESGVKDPHQLKMRFEYRGEVMQLDMVDAQLQTFTWTALLSKVRDFTHAL